MKSGYCEELKREKVVKIARLSGCTNFVVRTFPFIRSISTSMSLTKRPTTNLFLCDCQCSNS